MVRSRNGRSNLRPICQYVIEISRTWYGLELPVSPLVGVGMVKLSLSLAIDFYRFVDRIFSLLIFNLWHIILIKGPSCIDLTNEKWLFEALTRWMRFLKEMFQSYSAFSLIYYHRLKGRLKKDKSLTYMIYKTSS